MEDNFLKETNIIEKTEDEKDRELLLSILKTRSDLSKAHKNFEYAEDELIDYYSYQIKANQSKLDYLIKLAKNRGLVLGRNKQMQIVLEKEKKKVV